MKKVASLQYEVIFKKAFGQKDIFVGFVRDMLGIELEIEAVETEKRFETPIGDPNVCFTLFAQDKKQRIVVGVQHEKEAGQYNRALRYYCEALLQQVAAEPYRYHPPLQVFTIVVQMAEDKHGNDVAIMDLGRRDLQGNSLEVSRYKTLFLFPKYVNDETPAQYREWLEAIADSWDEVVEESKYKNPLILQVFGEILTDA